MPRFNELPVIFDNKMDLDSTVLQPIPRVSTNSSSVPFPANILKQAREGNDPRYTPSLPPQMEAVRSHTADEIVRMMNRTPLFMTSLDDAGGDADGENIELEAIRALQYEGSRVEVALGFKENGNEMVKAKRWKDGRDFYSQALGVLHRNAPVQTQTGNAIDLAPDSTSVVDQDAEHQEEKKIEEACYVNRAFCNLELQNYRSTTLDCAATLRLNSSNLKAYYRSSLALLALSKIPEALDACMRGRALSPHTPSFNALLSKIEARAAAIAASEATRRETESRLLKEKRVLAAAILARGITVRASTKPPALEDATIHLSPDPLSPSSTLVFPLLLLYPLHAQSDFIKAVPETDTLAQHLGYIFPLPWDKVNDYRVSNVELYVETGKGEGGLMKVGRNMALLAWLDGGKAVVVDGVVKVNVLIRGKASGWIEEVKARKGKGGQ